MASAAARGPLNTLLTNGGAQWIALGIGAYALAPDQVNHLIHRLSIAAAVPPPNGKHSSAPIIIHTNSGTANSEKGTLVTVVTYMMGAGCVWVSYSVLSTMLPEQISNMLPVTKSLFNKSLKNLAKNVVNVKEVLGQQIVNLLQKQESLEKKQDQTLDDLKGLKDDVDATRGDVHNVHDSVQRCEFSIDDVKQMQSFTARGVKLLVIAVSTILPGDNHITKELREYLRAGELVYSKRSPEDDRPRLSRQRTSQLTSSSNRQQQIDQAVENLDDSVVDRMVNDSSFRVADFVRS